MISLYSKKSFFSMASPWALPPGSGRFCLKFTGFPAETQAFLRRGQRLFSLPPRFLVTLVSKQRTPPQDLPAASVVVLPLFRYAFLILVPLLIIFGSLWSKDTPFFTTFCH